MTDVDVGKIENLNTLDLGEPPARKRVRKQKPSPYTISWNRIWPDDNTPQRITGEDLPHVIHDNALIGACTVRFVLAPKSNVYHDEIADRITQDIHSQIWEIDPTGDLSGNHTISFPAIIGKNNRGEREFYLDLSTTTPTRFQIIANCTLYDGEYECSVKGRGSPVPANIRTVSIRGLPAQSVLHNVGKDLYDALNLYRPNEIEVWDVIARMQKFESNPETPNWSGQIFACVCFKLCPPTSFPDDYVRDALPGWVSIPSRSQRFELHYTDRINHLSMQGESY
jgi:hypothetical protein